MMYRIKRNMTNKELFEKLWSKELFAPMITPPSQLVAQRLNSKGGFKQVIPTVQGPPYVAYKIGG